MIELLPSAKFTSRNENFVSTNKDVLKNRNWKFPIVYCFIWKLEFVSNILRMIAGIHDFITANSTWKFNHPQFLGTNDTSIKLLSRLILMKTFQNCPNKLHYISGFEHMAFTMFSCSFLYFQITAEISIIKKRTKRGLYFTCNALLKYFNSLV